MEYKLGFSSLLFLTLVIAFFVAKFSTLTPLAAWLYTFWTLVPAYLIIYQSWIYPFYISPLRSVPTVSGFPLWGHLSMIISEEAGVPQRRWHKEHGPIIRYFLLFGHERFSVTDTEALKQITIRNTYTWIKPQSYRNTMFPILGNGVFLAEGDVHAQQRKALTSGFSISSIKALSPIFWRKSLLLSRLWQFELRKEGVQFKSIEVLDWLSRATLDIIGEAGFGADFDTLHHPDTPIRQAYQRFFIFDNWSRLFHALHSQTRLARFLPMKANYELMASRRRILSFASEIISDKQSKRFSQTLSREKNIIALIVRDNSTSNGKLADGMTFDIMRDQVMTFLGAGHDTTATGIACKTSPVHYFFVQADREYRDIVSVLPCSPRKEKN